MGASFTTGNMGVSALAASTIKLILAQKPQAEIILVNSEYSSKPQIVNIDNSKLQIKVVNYRLSPQSQLSKNILYILLLSCIQKMIPISLFKKRIINSNLCLKTIYEANIIGQIRGGDSFSDIYGIKRLLYGLAPSFVAILLGKKHILLPQTYGPYNSKIAKYLARHMLKRSSVVLSREKEGIKTIESLTKTKNYNFCPDVAFMLDSVMPKRIDTYPPVNLKRLSPLLGINISGLLYSGGYNRNNMFGLKFDYKKMIYDLSIKFLENTDAAILYVPHTWGIGQANVESDPFACLDILDRLLNQYPNRLFVLDTNDIKYDQSELKGLIGLCDFFIGSRMHSCIAALSQGIPTIGIAYSKKFIGVFNSIGVGKQVLDARFESDEYIINNTINAYFKRASIKKELNNKLSAVKKHIDDAFKKIIV
jgi:polysaccharide pyruvyl transferase WcaK-like protein